MTLRELWKLSLEASSITWEFKEYYDYAGDVSPHVILKLMMDRQDLIVAMTQAMGKCHPNHDGRLILLHALERTKEAWPDEIKEDSASEPTGQHRPPDT